MEPWNEEHVPQLFVHPTTTTWFDTTKMLIGSKVRLTTMAEASLYILVDAGRAIIINVPSWCAELLDEDIVEGGGVRGPHIWYVQYRDLNWSIAGAMLSYRGRERTSRNNNGFYLISTRQDRSREAKE